MKQRESLKVRATSFLIYHLRKGENSLNISSTNLTNNSREFPTNKMPFDYDYENTNRVSIDMSIVKTLNNDISKEDILKAYKINLRNKLIDHSLTTTV